jgi:dTDP-4-dehydrorhamnose 3,5-epimerase
MEFRTFEIAGPVEVTPQRHTDDRGYFAEILRMDDLCRQIGEVEFVQVNESLSIHTGTIRGIHFQIPPEAQGKLVRCVAGAIFDVAVDLRQESPSFGKWLAITLTAGRGNQLWIPPGFGHAFSTLEPNSIVSYRVTDYYSREHDMGIAWDDPDLAIDWPDSVDEQTLSSKDRSQPAFRDFPAYFSMKGDQCA